MTIAEAQIIYVVGPSGTGKVRTLNIDTNDYIYFCAYDMSQHYSKHAPNDKIYIVHCIYCIYIVIYW